MYYVYMYRDPGNDNLPIYVGKGKGRRAWHHLNISDWSAIQMFVQRRKLQGYVVQPEIVAWFDSEEAALIYENDLILKYGRLSEGGTLLNKMFVPFKEATIEPKLIIAKSWVSSLVDKPKKKGHKKNWARIRANRRLYKSQSTNP